MRKVLIKYLLNNNLNDINDKEFDKIAELTEGYSGSDLTNLAKDAALGPIRGNCATYWFFTVIRMGKFRELNKTIFKLTELKLENMNKKDSLKVRAIRFKDFEDSLKRIRRSVPVSAIEVYNKWNAEYGDITC